MPLRLPAPLLPPAAAACGEPCQPTPATHLHPSLTSAPPQAASSSARPTWTSLPAAWWAPARPTAPPVRRRRRAGGGSRALPAAQQARRELQLAQPRALAASKPSDLPYPSPPIAHAPRAANAFDDRFTPGGSSCGSAVAVAEGLCTFALGTDTAGSGAVLAAVVPPEPQLPCAAVAADPSLRSRPALCRVHPARPAPQAACPRVTTASSASSRLWAASLPPVWCPPATCSTACPCLR